MGNCQAAEAAAVIIQHPGNNRIERMYWSVSAQEIMGSNPGYYVALVVESPTLKAENGLPLKQLKLLRPDDPLLIGHVYRLISFEDVLKEFDAKKCVKLGKLLKESGIGVEIKRKESARRRNQYQNSESDFKGEQDTDRRLHDGGSSSGLSGGVGRQYGVVGGGQWKPALQSISEIET